MKLSCLLVALGCTGLQLLMANTGKSQELSDVRVSLELKNEPLRTAFTKIEEQSSFRFAYNRKQIDNYQNVTLSRGNYTVEKALELLLVNTPLLYRKVNNKIVVYRREEATEIRGQDDLPAAAVGPFVDGEEFVAFDHCLGETGRPSELLDRGLE